MNKGDKSVVVANTVSLIIMLMANFVAGAGLFSTTTVAAVSYKYDTLFAPAGYAFIIWPFLFLLAIAFVTYQWLILIKDDPKEFIKRGGYWFTISNILNTIWVYLWTHELLGCSVFIILLLLFSLCVLAVRLGAELSDEPVRTLLFVWWPIIFYLGWMMVASIACIAAWLVSNGWNGGLLGEEGWTITMIAVASFVYVLLVIKRNLREASIVGIWAFIAIAVRQWHLHYNIALAAVIASTILLVVISIHAFKNRYYNPLAKLKRGEWK